jgi:pimeloyl-ACP methyl ester carboxylesterase
LIGPLSRASRVCAYDRAGTGMSDPRTRTDGVTSATQATELHVLLERAGIKGPYVLLAHSYGGFVTRLFAAAHPAEVTGMVLIESSQEDEVPAYDRYYHEGPEADWIDGGTKLDIHRTADLLHATARHFGDIPLLVIQAHRYEDVLSEALWRRTQADLATLSTDGVLIRSGQGGHFVQDDNPELVVAGVTAVLRSAREGTPLQACSDLANGLVASCS